MSVDIKLSELEGSWKGTNKLYLSWVSEEPIVSDSTASVSMRVNDQFFGIEYKWAYEGNEQEGLLILGCDSKSDAVQAVWTDSWHNGHKFMLCDGNIDADGKVSVKGYYTVPEHPDWGWRTEIVPGSDSFKYLMYNVSPDGVEELAVETEFSRV
jgi:hypothetical protein